jgi:hypothetical protein
MVKQCIEEGKRLEKDFKGAEDLDFIVLTGGHSQWYFINDILLGRLPFRENERLYLPKIQAQPERLIKLSKPHETVALGLVYQLIHVDIKRCSANSVWVRFEIDDYKTGIKKVIDFGEYYRLEKSIQVK